MRKRRGATTLEVKPIQALSPRRVSRRRKDQRGIESHGLIVLAADDSKTSRRTTIVSLMPKRSMHSLEESNVRAGQTTVVVKPNEVLSTSARARRKKGGRGNGQSLPGSLTSGADPALLRNLIGHYGRLFLDIQKIRTACSNRCGAMERDGVSADNRGLATALLEQTEDMEKSAGRLLEKLMRSHPLFEFIDSNKGLGSKSIGELLAVLPPLDNFANVAKLWAFCGYAVRAGRAPRRTAGMKLGYNPEARVICFRIGDAFMKSGKGGKYRALYDQKKAEYQARERSGASNCHFGQHHMTRGGKTVPCGDKHAHLAALRYAIKGFLKDLWVEWRRKTGDKRLPDAQTSSIATPVLLPHGELSPLH
jgi:hypothetical protein